MDEPNAIIFIQVLALSHRAQVLNLERYGQVLCCAYGAMKGCIIIISV